jgi:anaerobic ribonucleoside-triphosphate reductase activating protein
MLKYVDVAVVFSEVPDEVTLAINISNCPCHCEGCHSAYLARDIGKPLDAVELGLLIERCRGVSCVAFMGGDAAPEEVDELAFFVKDSYPELKTAWYSGRQELSPHIGLENFDFIKLGPYIPSRGGLESPDTNQRFYAVHGKELEDITYRFTR